MVQKWFWIAAAMTVGAVGCGKSIECGKGTTEQDGECVATTPSNSTSMTNGATNGATSCGPGTELTGGQCVVTTPVTCGPGTMLDANSGECVVTDTVCGPSTAFDMASGTCMPTDMVCAAGTTFDAAMGICMPDASCAPGDVILDGVCASPAEELFANADMMETENNDPFFGGTAEPFALPATGETFVIAGAIDVGTDLDGDMVDDQDLDVFTFTATAGQWITVSSQPIDGPPVGFVVRGPDGYERYTRLGAALGASREFVIRTDGDYELTIGPQTAVTSLPTVPGDVNTTAYSWVTEVTVNDPPTATMADFSMPVTGDLTDLRANLLTQGGFAAGNILSVQADALGGRAELIFFDGDSVTAYSDSFGPSSVVVPASGDLTVLVDWVELFDSAGTYEINVADSGMVTDLGTIASGASVDGSVTLLDGSAFFQVTLPAGHIAEFTQVNSDNEPVDIVVTPPGGNRLNQLSPLGGTGFGPQYQYELGGLAGGTFLIEVSSFTQVNNLVLTTTAIQPSDLGTWTLPAVVNESSTTALGKGQSIFMTVDLAADASFTGTLDGAAGEDVDFRIYDGMGTQLEAATTNAGETFDWLLPAGTLLLEVDSFAASTGWTLAGNVAAFVATAETEPNDDIAGANSGLAPGMRVTGDVDMGEVDWFSFTVATSSMVTISLAEYMGPVVVDLAITNALGEVIAAGGLGSGLPGETEARTFLEPGTYYVSVTGQGPSSYLLSMTTASTGADLDDAGNNDDAANAQAAVLVDGYTIAGGFNGGADEDWYSFDLAAAQSFRDVPGAVFYDSAMMVITPAGGLIDLPLGTSYMAMTGFTDGGPNGYLARFALPPTNNLSSTVATAIPDAGFPNDVVTDIITVPNGPPCTLTSVEVSVDITHTFRGDIYITLVSPTGTNVRLWGDTGGPDDDLVGTFPLDLTPDESLAAFAGETAGGDWTITVSDTVAADTGTFNSWSLGYNCQ